jgi:hypothetical protein
MQLILSLMVAMSSPIAVSTCDVTDLYNTASLVEFGSPINFRSLRLTFRNADDAVATEVAFDVRHGGERTTVIDRGRFSKGVAIEHLFVNELPDGGYSRIPDSCSVAAVTFADGRRWTAPRGIN